MIDFNNPFPQVGCNSEIDPVGYDKELVDIKNLVLANVGQQPIIINIYGMYGQGKTTILDYLHKQFNGNWANLTVKTEDISNFPDLENNLVLYQNIHEQEGSEGVFVILDEMQHIDAEGTLSDTQKRFLGTLRNFADNNIPGLDSKKFILCIAMHPGTKAFLKEHGHLDVEQRTKTFTLNLKDIDYYMAYMLVKKHFEKINKSFDEFFDESFIYAFYMMLPYLEEQQFGTNRLNGRTYSQLFFQLIQFIWSQKKEKLSFDILKNILLGKFDLELGDVKVKLPNIEMYYETYNKLDDSEKYFWDKFVLNPKWHFKKEFKSIDEVFIEKLVKKQLISHRKCIVLSPQNMLELDNETRRDIDTLRKDRIFLNGEKTLIFLDTADDSIYEKFENHKINDVYRINDEIIKVIYNFHPPVSDSDDLIKYFEKEPAEKVDCFYSILSKNINLIDKSIRFEKVSVDKCKSGMKYKYLNVIYKVLGEIKHNIAIFYYAKNYGNSDFLNYFNDIKSEIENSNFDLAVVFVGPFVIEELPKERVIIRKMDNRIFIKKITRDEMIDFLKGDTRSEDYVIKNSIKLFIQEAVEKGFTIPLVGFQEKIKNSYAKFLETFIKDIKKSWKIELSKKINEDIDPEFSHILKTGLDVKANLNLAENSLEEFMELEYGKINGAKISKFERNFLALFGTKEESIEEIHEAKNKYFAGYSRFDPIDLIPPILENKSILEITSGTYKLIDPSDYLEDILNLLNRLDLNELLMTKDSSVKRSIYDLNLLLDDLDENADYKEKGLYNSNLLRILKKCNSIELGTDELSNKIYNKYNEIKDKLDSKYPSISFSNVEISDYLNNLDNSQIKDLYNKYPFNQDYLNSNNLIKYISLILVNHTHLDVDKQFMSNLESILDKINDHKVPIKNIDVLDNLSNKILSIKTKKNVREQNIIIKSLENLFINSKTDLSTSELEIVYKILLDIDLYVIKPVYIQLDRCNQKIEKFKEIQSTLSNYETSFDKLNNFYRRDNYLDNVKTISVNPEAINKEFKNFDSIGKHNIRILDKYIDFIFNNCKKGEIEQIISTDKDINANEKMSLSEYLDYVMNLDGTSYLTHFIKNKFSVTDEIPSQEIELIIDNIKDSESEFKDLKSTEILNDILMPKGFLKRIIYYEEYYKNGKRIENKSMNYKIEEA